MKKHVLTILGCLFLLGLNAQRHADFGFTFDHHALSVKDLDASAKFYGEVLGLREMEDAAKNPAIRWFVLRDGRQLHLIQTQEKDISLTKTVHFSFAAKHFDKFVKFLEDQHIPYSDWLGEPGKIAQRPDGIRQVYVQDPDGYWIEINDVRRK